MENLQKTAFGKLATMALLLMVSLTLLLSSCNDGEPHGGGSPIREFKMNCVILTKAQVQSWVDSGWTKPGAAGRINDIVLQFYSANVSELATNMQLVAYPGESVTSVKRSGEQLLAIDTTCKAVSFAGKTVLSNNEIRIADLDILNEDGTLKDFDFIRLSPQQFKKNTQYISFKIEKVVKGQVEATKGDGSLPCPPFCCPPEC